MDGAIILNAMATRIVYANVQLMPDPTIPSAETGTRHRTAERVAKQTGALVISISQQRDVVTLYVSDARYQLEEISDVLAKTNQAVTTLETYRHPVRPGVDPAHRARVPGRRDARRRARGAPAGRDDVAHALRDRAQRGRARGRGPADQDPARRDVGVGARRRGRDGARLLPRRGGRRLRARARSSCTRCPTRSCSRSSRWPSFWATRAPSRRSTTPSRRAATACCRRSRACPRASIAHVVEHFGTLETFVRASQGELEEVEGVGAVRAREIREGLRRLQEQNLVDRYLNL